jgi:hypothetical protein
MAGFLDWLKGLWLSSQAHTCECGTLYKVTVIKVEAPASDHADCQHCGTIMEARCNSTSVPHYELIRRPETTNA